MQRGAKKILTFTKVETMKIICIKKLGKIKKESTKKDKKIKGKTNGQ